MTEFRRAQRPADRRVIAGVCAALADHYSIPVIWVQVGFVVATWLQGAGLLAYLLLWRFLPLARPEGPEVAPEPAAPPRPSGEVGRVMALLAVAAGGLWLLSSLGVGPGAGLLGPVLLAVAGVAVVWRQLDDAALADWLRQTRGAGYWLRLALGLALILLAGGYVAGAAASWRSLVDVLAAAGVAAVGLGLIFGGWITTLWNDLGQERRQRIRSEERADMAAHLHDSVLQTLALLQKRAGDPAAVSTLARRQERELRAWLYGQSASAGETLASALRAEADDIELAYRVRIELVTVGDASVTAAVGALARAVREALVNAAKHSGADRIDLFCEVADDGAGPAAQVFVRDRGRGFDPEQVPPDRRGVRDSIVERISRYGGSATVRSAPGEGAEVELSMPVGAGRDGTQEDGR